MPTKIFPKISQTLNKWLKRIHQLILHLRLWKWAAVKTYNFHYFEISFTRILEFNIYSSFHIDELFVIEIRLIKPTLYYMTAPFTEEAFCEFHELPLDTFADKIHPNHEKGN